MTVFKKIKYTYWYSKETGYRGRRQIKTNEKEKSIKIEKINKEIGKGKEKCKGKGKGKGKNRYRVKIMFGYLNTPNVILIIS